MNNNFAKTALAISISAVAAYSQNSFAASQPATSGDTVVIGCSVPSAGTTGGTVYVVDAVSSASTSATTYTISLPSAVAAGQSCAAAVQAITKSTGAPGSSVYFHPVNPASGAAGANTAGLSAESVVVPGTGYGLVAHTFVANTNAAGQTNSVYVGCTAGTTTSGSTVYSVDTGAVTEAANIATIQGVIGKPCSQGLAGVAQSATTGSFAFTVTGATNVTIPNAGYGLNLYTVQ